MLYVELCCAVLIASVLWLLLAQKAEPGRTLPGSPSQAAPHLSAVPADVALLTWHLCPLLQVLVSKQAQNLLDAFQVNVVL